MLRTGKSVYLVTACTAKQHAYECEKEGGHCTKYFMALAIQNKITFRDIETQLVASVVKETKGLQTPEIHLFGQARQSEGHLGFGEARPHSGACFQSAGRRG